MISYIQYKYKQSKVGRGPTASQSRRVVSKTQMRRAENDEKTPPKKNARLKKMTYSFKSFGVVV